MLWVYDDTQGGSIVHLPPCQCCSQLLQVRLHTWNDVDVLQCSIGGLQHVAAGPDGDEGDECVLCVQGGHINAGGRAGVRGRKQPHTCITYATSSCSHASVVQSRAEHMIGRQH